MIDWIYRDLLYEDSVRKEIVITTEDGLMIGNDMLHKESFELNESLNSSNELEFGSCESSSIKFRVSNVIESLKGKKITAVLYLNNDRENGLNLGEYTVVSDKPTADRSYRDITAYDKLYEVINTDVTTWYNGLKFPMSLKRFRDSFFQFVGITQDDVALLNDSMQINKGLDQKNIMGSTVMNAICGINGCFGHLDRQGVFKYVFLDIIMEALYPRDTLYPSDDLYPSQVNGEYVRKNSYLTAQYEDYEVKSITGVRILNEQSVVVGSHGSSANEYLIQGNFLTYGYTTSQLNSVAQNVYEKVQGLVYLPLKTEAAGNPCREVGDVYFLSTSTEIVKSYILERKLKGIQALRDTYMSDGNEYRADKSNSIQQLRAAVATTNSNLATTNSNLATTNSNLAGTTARVSSLEADHVSVGSLNAVSARVGTLEADHVSVESLNAVSAKVNTISANYVTANTVDTKISTAISNFSKAMYCNQLTIGSSTFTGGRTINTFDSSGKFLGQITVLAT